MQVEMIFFFFFMLHVVCVCFIRLFTLVTRSSRHLISEVQAFVAAMISIINNVFTFQQHSELTWKEIHLSRINLKGNEQIADENKQTAHRGGRYSRTNVGKAAWVSARSLPIHVLMVLAD